MKFFNAEVDLWPSIVTGYGKTPEEALGALLSIWRDEWAPMVGEQSKSLEEYKDDILVYAPEVGMGYVVGTGDDLGRPIHMTAANTAFAALMTSYRNSEAFQVKVSEDAPSTTDVSGLFVAKVDTRRTLSLGFGNTAEEAVQALLTRWRVDYAPQADADEGYLAEIREDISIFEVKLGQAYIDDPSNTTLARPVLMKGDDPSLDAVFEEYTQVAKPWRG